MLAIAATTADSEHRIAWISESANDSLSIGLADRAFVSPRFHARHFLWNAYNRVTLHYLVPGDTNDLLPVLNPHLTFHPPIYFHLRANDDEELFAGIADVNIMLDQDGEVPWIRFVSRPVREMRKAGSSRNSSNTTTIRIPVQSSDVSIGIGVDIIRPGGSAATPKLVDHFMDYGGYRYHIFCELCRPQPPTLSWYHQY